MDAQTSWGIGLNMVWLHGRLAVLNHVKLLGRIMWGDKCLVRAFYFLSFRPTENYSWDSKLLEVRGVYDNHSRNWFSSSMDLCLASCLRSDGLRWLDSDYLLSLSLSPSPAMLLLLLLLLVVTM